MLPTKNFVIILSIVSFSGLYVFGGTISDQTSPNVDFRWLSVSCSLTTSSPVWNKLKLPPNFLKLALSKWSIIEKRKNSAIKLHFLKIDSTIIPDLCWSSEGLVGHSSVSKPPKTIEKRYQKIRSFHQEMICHVLLFTQVSSNNNFQEKLIHW